MSKSVKVTFVTPVYNVNKYLEECLLSLEKIECNKEVIIVDDRGSENPYPIIDKFLARNKGWRVIKNEANMGIGFSRNQGIENASKDSTHIYFIDSDDYCDPNEVSEIVKLVKPGKSLLYRKFLSFNKKDKYVCDPITQKSLFGKIGEDEYLPFFIWGNFWAKEQLRNVRFELRIYEDVPFVVKFLNENGWEPNGSKWEFHDKLANLYRLRKTSSTKKKPTALAMNCLAKQIESISGSNFKNKKFLVDVNTNDFYEKYYLMNKAERAKIKIKPIISKKKEKQIKTAMFFQKAVLFNLWFNFFTRHKNYD